MNFEEKLKEAGFSTKAEFARYLGKHINTVCNWKNEPPFWALRILEIRIKVKKILEPDRE